MQALKGGNGGAPAARSQRAAEERGRSIPSIAAEKAIDLFFITIGNLSFISAPALLKLHPKANANSLSLTSSCIN